MDLLERGGRDLAMQLLVGQQGDRGARHAVEIVERVQKAGDAVVDDFGQPAHRDATTGTSHAIASSAARPKLSCDDGSRNTSATDSSGTT